MSLMLSRLNRTRFRSMAVVLEGQPDGEEYQLHGVDIIRCGLGQTWKRWWTHPAFLLALGRDLARRKVDVVHCHQTPEQWIGCLSAAAVGVPVIRTIHKVPDGRFVGLGLRARLLTALTAAYTSVTLEWSSAFEKEFRIRQEDVKYIPNGIDVAEFRPPAGARERTRRELNLEDGELLVLGVGRLVANKDFATMMRAVALAQEKAPKLRLAIAGDGPEMENLRNEIQRSGLGASARMLGVRTDVADLLAGCDVFMTTSLTESMGYSAAEAMAAGRPVVATDTVGLRSLVACGKTGLLIPPSSPEEGARALLRLAGRKQLRDSLGEAAQRVVAEQFCMERMVEGYEGMYEQVVRQRRSARGRQYSPGA